MPDGPELTPAAADGFPELRDFPDKLPPVLVKELRQGLRGRMFIVPFLILQGLLIFTNAEPGRTATLIFWHFILITVVFLLPLRNLSALGEEREANTLDTLILTRLTPWRIVWGKWCAGFAQSALTAVAVAPYLLVRYLNTGSSIFAEALLLGSLLVISGAVAGAFTAFSVIKSPLQRNGIAALVIIAVYVWLCGPLLNGTMKGWEGLPVAGLIQVMVFAVWVTLFSLWHAAASIAPAALNVTTPRRLMSLTAVLVSAVIVAFYSRDLMVRSCLMVMLVAINLVEMGEPLSPHPGIAAAFDRRGLAGQAAALLFRPGWDSGVIFCALLWIAAGVVTGFIDERGFQAAAALCFFPVSGRLLLPARMRAGAAPMLLTAFAANVISQLLLAADRNSLVLLLPGIHGNFQGDRFFQVMSTLLWTGLAILLAGGSLLTQHPRPKR